jgi:hypothetical protein
MISTADLNRWTQQIISTVDLNKWFQYQISTDKRNKSYLNSWSKQMISTADLNRWNQQIISTIDFNRWSILNNWSKQMISKTDLNRWTQQIGWQIGWLNNFSSLPTTAPLPSNSLSHNVWSYRYIVFNSTLGTQGFLSLCLQFHIGHLHSWAQQVISTADFNRWTQQIILTIDFNS